MLSKEHFPTLRWLTAEAYPLKPVTFTDYRIKGWDSRQSESLVISQPLYELAVPAKPFLLVHAKAFFTSKGTWSRIT
jgi:hypothetical protein